jgi:hypothetical protein
MTLRRQIGVRRREELLAESSSFLLLVAVDSYMTPSRRATPVYIAARIRVKESTRGSFCRPAGQIVSMTQGDRLSEAEKLVRHDSHEGQ